MTPQPVISPSFHETEGLQALEGRSKILDDVVRTIFVHFGVKAAKQESSGLQGLPKLVNGLHGIDQVFENIHRGKHIEADWSEGGRF